MSWVTNVVLFYSTGEEWIDQAEDDEDEDIQYMGVSSCLKNINAWLRGRGWVELVNLGEVAGGRDRHSFEAEIWGAALNHLEIGLFLAVIKEQEWQEPENVQVMVRDQEEERFTLWQLQDIAANILN